MLVCDVHALNGVMFISLTAICAAVPRALAEVPHMTALETC